MGRGWARILVEEEQPEQFWKLGIMLAAPSVGPMALFRLPAVFEPES